METDRNLAKPLLDYIGRHITLSEGEIEKLCESVVYRRYLKGQYIVQQGDVCKIESFILKGCVKTFYIDQEGQEHIVSFGIENWWVSDLGSFILQEPANYNVQCLEPTEVIQFVHDRLENLYTDIPALERFFRIILQKAYVAAQERIVGKFSLSAKEQYIKFRKQYPLIEQRVPQYMIASYLGMSREFLSKIKSQLIQEQ
jgi:CRP-like cAMP-binding protein